KLELVREPGAARCAHAHAQPDALAASGEERLNMARGFFSKRNGAQATFFSSSSQSRPRFLRYSATAALIASSARIEQWILTGGSDSSSAICVFFIVTAWSCVLALI